MELLNTDRDELKKYAEALNHFVERVNLVGDRRNVPALLTGPLPPMEVELLFARIKRQNTEAGNQLEDSYKQLLNAANEKSPIFGLFPSQSAGKLKYEAYKLINLMLDIAGENNVKAGADLPVQEPAEAKQQNDNAEDKFRQFLTLKSFIEIHCDLSAKPDVQSKVSLLHEYNSKGKIKLPKLAQEYRKGQHKYYYVDDLKKNWPTYQKKMPTLPPLKVAGK